MRFKVSVSSALAVILSLWLTSLPVLADGVYNPSANAIGDYQGIDSNSAAGGGATCSPGAAATNFLARTSGLSATETKAYCNMINGLVTDGIITGNLSGAAGCGSVLDALYILATNNTTTAALNLCGTSFSLVTHGSPTFTADVGYTGDGAAAYLDTQWTPSANAVNFTLNSGSIGAYVQSSSASTAAAIMGAATTGEFSYMVPVNTGNIFTFSINDNTFANFSNSNPQGAWVNTRTGASALNLYKNGSTTPAATSSGASTALPLNPLSLLALDNNGTVGNFTTNQASAFFMGAGLTAVQAVAINNRINAYMTALGSNHVY